MLDSRGTIAAIDKRDMFGVIEGLPKHLAEGLRRGRMSGLPRFTPKDVFVCGLGGSAIGGDLLAEWMSGSSDIHCTVCRRYEVPPHMSKDSLVIVASYSGNTEETLAMFEASRKSRAKIVTVGSGGQLAEMSETYNIPFARVPTGLVPRSTVGYMFGAMLGILERSGLVEPEKQVEETIRVLAKVIHYCKPSVKTGDNPAKILAHELIPNIPVVIGYGLSSPVAKRWANQLNENGKCLAFSSELPEMDHNLIVGWMKDPRSKGFSAIFLDHDCSGKAMDRRVRATKDMIAKVAPVYSSEAIGLSPMAKMFSLLIVGDYASAYMGVLRGEDPSSTEPIAELKSLLSKK